MRIFENYLFIFRNPKTLFCYAQRFFLALDAIPKKNTATDNLTNNKLRKVTIANVAPNKQSDVLRLTQKLDADVYTYDRIGNLIGDISEGINSISWNLSGKIESINFASNHNPAKIEFNYDPMGNRISKCGYAKNATKPTCDYYSRDASGNVMAVYHREANTNIKPTVEYTLYGSSRLGTLSHQLNIPTGTQTTIDYSQKPAHKSYELTNHLGNVMAVVAAHKKPIDTNSDGKADYYTANLQNANDYYAFGAPIPSRSFTSGSYRYGYNTQEKVDEIAQGHYTAPFWEYDSRTGIRWNVDPISFPWQSPYVTNNDNPIYFTDELGLFGKGGKKGKKTQGNTCPSDKTALKHDKVPSRDVTKTTKSSTRKSITIPLERLAKLVEHIGDGVVAGGRYLAKAAISRYPQMITRNSLDSKKNNITRPSYISEDDALNSYIFGIEEDSENSHSAYPDSRKSNKRVYETLENNNGLLMILNADYMQNFVIDIIEKVVEINGKEFKMNYVNTSDGWKFVSPKTIDTIMNGGFFK